MVIIQTPLQGFLWTFLNFVEGFQNNTLLIGLFPLGQMELMCFKECKMEL
jgi:hypothetical protein